MVKEAVGRGKRIREEIGRKRKKRRKKRRKRRRRKRKRRKRKKGERERRREEKGEERRRMVWKDIRGMIKKERKRRLTERMESVIERKIEMKGIEERIAEGKKIFMLTEMEEEEEERKTEEKREFLEEIRDRYGQGLFNGREKIKMGRIMEKAREERMKKRRVMATNRKLWIEGKDCRWNEEERM